jgi:histidyl-tRNA synthetase
MDKCSNDEFDLSIQQQGISKENLQKIKNFLEFRNGNNNFEILNRLKVFRFNEEFTAGLSEIEGILQILKKLDIEDNYVKISLKLARGLSYYTGSVFETVFDDFKNVGSISGGGRYDNLVTLLSSGKQFPGVGATIGISRLFTELLGRELLDVKKSSVANILVTVQNQDFITNYIRIANKLRKAGIKTEVYLQDKNLASQLSYADRKKIKFVIIANEMELLENKAIIRNLETKEQKIIRTEYVGREILEAFK